jgi:drug/metabolite transporter (DMT)-like permease
MPSRRDLSLLAIGVIAVGTSGPFIAASTLPIVVLIFWRNFVGALVTLPFALREWRLIFTPKVRLSVYAGVLLAAHFLFFFVAMRWTTVAAGTALVAIQPVFAALIAKFRGHIVPSRAWLGMAIAFVGIIMIGGVDYSISTRALLGDLAGIGAAALGAAYVSVTASARRTVSTSIHTTVCYATCALVVGVIALALDAPFWGYSQREWLIIGGLIIGAQLLGHSVFNLVLKSTSATIVSMIVLFETPVAALIAGLWLGQAPSLAIYPAIVILLFGSAMVVSRT